MNTQSVPEETRPEMTNEGPEAQERKVREQLMAKVSATLGRVPFVRELVAAYLCAIDPETPKRVKAILLGALVYFITPIDAVPDVIAALGFTDDAAVFWFAFRQVESYIRPHHVEEAERRLSSLRD